MKSWRRSLSLGLFWAVGTLVVAEAVLRVVAWPAISWEWQLEAPQRVPDAATILVDPRLRDRASYPSDAPGWVALGDSFTAGTGVAAERAWPALLSEQVGDAVLNLGLANSGPQQHARLLEAHAWPHVRGARVVWALYANDLQDDAVMNTFAVVEGRMVPLDGRDHWIARRVATWREIPLPGFVRIRSALLRHWIHRWEQRERDVHAPVDAEAMLPRVLARVQHRVEAAGGSLTVVLIPPEGLGSSHPLDAQHRRLATVLAPWRPVVPSLRAEHYLSGERDPMPEGARHLTEAGHLAVAEAIATRIAESRFRSRHTAPSPSGRAQSTGG